MNDSQYKLFEHCIPACFFCKTFLAPPEQVGKVFGLDVARLQQLLKATTQKGIHTTVHPIQRIYRTDHLQLHANDLTGRWAMDHIHSNVKFIRSNTGAFIISNGYFTWVLPRMKKDDECAATLLKYLLG